MTQFMQNVWSILQHNEGTTLSTTLFHSITF